MKTLQKISFFALLLTQICFAQWTQTSLQNDVLVQKLAVSGINLFACGDYQGNALLQRIYRSTDGGDNWFEVDSGLTTGGWSNLIVCGKNIYYSNGRGIFYSTNDGNHWNSLNAGLPDTNVYGLAVGSIGSGETNIFVSTRSGIYFSKNRMSSWNKIWACDSSSEPFNGVWQLVLMFTSDNSAILFGQLFWQNGLVRLTEKDTSWIVDTLLTDKWVSLTDVNDKRLFVGTYGDGLFLSTDYGSNWNQLNSGLIDKTIRAFINSELYLFIGTFENGVFTSSDTGLSWIESNLGFPPLQGCYSGCPYVFDFAIIGTDIFAATWDGVWRRPIAELVPVELVSLTASTNGKEVKLIWSTATELNNQGFEVQRKFGSNDFATVGSVKGHGTTTSPNNYTYIDKLIDAGKYFYRLKQIDYGGTFEYSNEIEVEVRTLDRFTLEQNFPNPFNPTTTIGFGIPEKGNVRLSVLNILGEEIKVLLNEEKEAGYHSVEFNGKELPSGVYFYQLNAGSFVETKKMILLK